MLKSKCCISFFLLILLVSVTSCTPSHRQRDLKNWLSTTDKIKVLSTIPMTADLIRRIGGDEVACVSLIPDGLDPHSYELVKGDDELLYSADAVFAIGLGLEHGASLSHLLATSSSTVFLGDALMERQPQKMILVDRAVDPHIWMDLSLFALTIPSIVDRLVELDPSHADLFRKRGDELYKELLIEHERIFNQLQSIDSKKRYLVTTHDAFNYFTRAYLCDHPQDEKERQQRCVAPEGLAPDMQLSFYDIKRVVDHLERFHIKKLFAEANLSKDALLKIMQAATDRGLEVELVFEPLYGDSMETEHLVRHQSVYPFMISHNARVFYENIQ